MKLRDVARSMADRAFERIAPPVVGDEPPWLRDVVDHVNREFMAGPPLTLHLPVPELFASVWATIRESALAGPMDRATREVIAASVSLANQCPFCIDSHTASASVLGADRAAKAIRADDIDHIADARLRAAARWASATKSSGDPLLDSPPFAPAEQPYAIGTALAFHYINRMVHVFLKPWPISVPSFVNRRSFMTRVNGFFPGRLLGVSNLPGGDALHFRQDEPAPSAIPSAFAKVEGAPDVARAWGWLATVAETAGRRVLPEPTRQAVLDAIDAWDGSDPPLGREWVGDSVDQLATAERPAAVFALTCALAAYRIDDALVADVRRAHPTDADLVSIAAWSSFHATRRIATWI